MVYLKAEDSTLSECSVFFHGGIIYLYMECCIFATLDNAGCNAKVGYKWKHAVIHWNKHQLKTKPTKVVIT